MVQTLHEYTMPENWLQYQTIVSWDTNNYTEPISEGHHHEVEKHIRVPDRNLLFTPETTIDFNLKRKIQEYKNRILWQDVKEAYHHQSSSNELIVLRLTFLPKRHYQKHYFMSTIISKNMFTTNHM